MHHIHGGGFAGGELGRSDEGGFAAVLAGCGDDLCVIRRKDDPVNIAGALGRLNGPGQEGFASQGQNILAW